MAFSKSDWEWDFFRDFWKYVGDHYEDWKLFPEFDKNEKYLMDAYNERIEMMNKYNNHPLALNIMLGFLNYLDDMDRKENGGNGKKCTCK